MKEFTRENVAKVNFKLDCVAELLRAVWDGIDCGGETAKELSGCLGHVVNALAGLSRELTELTGLPEGELESRAS